MDNPDNPNSQLLENEPQKVSENSKPKRKFVIVVSVVLAFLFLSAAALALFLKSPAKTLVCPILPTVSQCNALGCSWYYCANACRAGGTPTGDVCPSQITYCQSFTTLSSCQAHSQDACAWSDCYQACLTESFHSPLACLPTPQPTPLPVIIDSSNPDRCNFPNLHFKVSCPPEVQVSTQKVVNQDTATITYLGKYQGDNPAWVDGATLVFTYNLLGQSTLNDLVDTTRASFFQDNPFATAEAIKIGNTTGYKVPATQVPSDFEITKLLIANGDNAYNEISIEIMDSHNQNYQAIIDKILSSFHTTY